MPQLHIFNFLSVNFINFLHPLFVLFTCDVGVSPPEDEVHPALDVQLQLVGITVTVAGGGLPRKHLR